MISLSLLFCAVHCCSVLAGSRIFSSLGGASAGVSSTSNKCMAANDNKRASAGKL
jgi:hypothetical protein